ncbi:MAG: Na/Pi cotransporter family protein [Candidatus Pacearchaeota archaeon]
METYLAIIFCITGIVLFLYGILCLSKKLETIVKEKIVFYLRNITKSPVRGTLFGFLLTALNQSSTATSVLTVALVSSGLLSFYSSLGILFGANIGTTITVNLVALGITKISFFFVLLGFILSFIKKTKKAGEIVFYTGLVLFGLFLVSLAIASLKDNPLLLGVLSKTDNPFLALLSSIIFTVIIQSSAVTISSAILLSQQGLLGLPIVMTIIIGANIGTTITALVASIGGSLSSKRTALAHLLFNVGGSLLFLPFIWQFHSILNLMEIPLANKAALFHVLFNLTTAIIFLIIVKPFSQFITTILQGEDDSIDLLPHYINKIFIKKPELALDLVEKELKREFILTGRMLKKALPLIQKFESKKFNEVNYLEEAVNNLQGEIASFLDELSRKNPLTKPQLKRFVSYSLLVDSIERIGDRALNIAQISRYKYLNQEKISKEILRLMKEVSNEIVSLNSDCIAIFEGKKYNPKKEKEIIEKINKIKELYQRRLENSKEESSSAMPFSDFMINLERIVYNCGDIAKKLRQE